jgi:hypothetical protein
VPTVSAITATGFTVSWSGLAAATGYHVTNNGNAIAAVTGTSYTFTGLACDTTFSVGVDAYNAGGSSPAATVNATTSQCTPTFTGSAASPTITVNGTGLGASPPTSYPANVTSCGTYTNNGNWYGTSGLVFLDNTNKWIAGQGTASGGACIGIIVVSWSDTQVVFKFGNSYDSFDHWSADSGDSYTITINGRTWNGNVSY